MIFFRLVAAALLLSAVSSVCSFLDGQENSQKPTIRVGVDRVNVGVIVTDHSGHFVEGLRREDFRIFDNGIEQPLTGFAAIEEPAQVLLLIELGPAVLFLVTNHVRASNALLNNLAPNEDRKSTRLNSSHSQISYAVFCLKKKKKKIMLINGETIYTQTYCIVRTVRYYLLYIECDLY